MKYKDLIFYIFLSVSLFFAYYFLLPSLIISLRYGKKPLLENYPFFKASPLNSKIKKTGIYKKLSKYFSDLTGRAGIFEIKEKKRWGILLFLLPPAFFFLSLFLSGDLLKSFLMSVLLFSLINLLLQARIKERNRAFTANLYKIYAFLNNQISSGIKATDAVREIHDLVDDPKVREGFVNFTAAYELTLDIDRSLESLHASFGGFECEMLCVSIKQCIETGGAGKTLKKMEDMSFSKHFNLLQAATEKFKSRLLLAGLVSLVPLVIILAAPVIYEAVSGFLQMIEY